MKFLIKLIISVLFMGVLAGCASFIDEDFQEISVSLQCRERLVRAECVAENSRGKWYFRAPGVVKVSNDLESLSITCKGPYTPRFTVAAPLVPTWGLAGNVLAGGLIGATYDIYNNTGLKYPEEITISNPACN